MKLIIVALGAVLGAALLVQPRAAFAETEFATSPPENNYPLNITFKADITSDQEITDVTLRFELKNRNQSGFGKPESLTAGTAVSTSVLIDTNPETNWLPVGNEFSYFWEATLADGSVVESPTESFTYLPPERDWVEVGNDLLRVYYYGERTNTANRFLEAADDAYNRVGKEVLNATLEHLPVKVILFVSTEEVDESQPSKGTTVEAAGIVTCGYRPGSADDIIVVAARCGSGSSVDTFRHELGHIMNAAAGESALVTLPSWLDEGLSVLAQEENGFEGAFRSALRRDDLLPFNRLNLIPSDPSQTILFYGQSHAMVVYLIDTYGEQKLADLMVLTKDGTRFDRAFEQIFGMDMLGFEEEFREANGLPSANAPVDPTPEANDADEQPAVPTATAEPSSPAVSGSSDDGLDPFLIGSIGGAVVFALIAIFLLLLALLLGNRQPATAGPEPAGDEDGPGGRGPDQSRWGRPD